MCVALTRVEEIPFEKMFLFLFLICHVFIFILFYFFFLLYNIVLVLPYINMNPPWVYMYSPPWTPLLPSSPYHPSRSSQCTSPKDPILKLDWWFISYMILYMFPCHSPNSSHPLPLPQSPKDCSIHLCLFCCLTYRIIFTIFYFFKYKFIYFNWRLITLQYCVGFAIHQHDPSKIYTCSPSWTPFPPSFPYHPSRSSQCTSPKQFPVF